MTIKHIINKAAVCVVLLILAMPCCLHAEEIINVVLLPFEVHSKDNKAILQESLYKELSSELSKIKSYKLAERDIVNRAIGGRPINEKTALAVGKETSARYVIMGSISEFGEQISADMRVVDVNQGRTMPGFFVQGRGVEGIGSTIVPRLRNDILIKTGVEHKVAGIEFKGNQKIESSAITQVIKSAKGSIFSEKDVSNDIKAIYQMGFFDDVSADVSVVPEGKIITFILQEKALISEVKIIGNKKISSDDIKAAMTVKPRQVLNPRKLSEDMIKIKGLYENKGYYNAEISYKIEKAGTKDSAISISITENNRIFIKKISFEGNQKFTEKELRKVMKTSEWNILYYFTDAGILKKDELRQDVGKISAFYLNNGFINAQVGEPQITHDMKGIYIKIPVTEGKQYKVGKVEIAGDDLKVSRKELLEKLALKKKEYYDRSAIMKDIEELTRYANDEGYAYADVTPRTSVREADTAVDVSYNITKGSLVYFNRITISGNVKTRDKVIRRALAIVEGELFSSTNMKRSYQNLERSRFFEEINFQTEKGPSETLTDVNVSVKEKQTGMFSIGAGYSASDNASITAHVQQENLFGRAQTLSLRATLSGNRRLYEASFIEPYLFDMPLYSKWDLWNFERYYDTYTLDSFGFGASFGHPIWEYFYGSIGYRLSRDTIKDLSAFASSLTKSQQGTYKDSSVGLSISRDTTDDNFFPTKGSRNSVGMTYAGGILQGDWEYTKYSAQSAWFFPLPLSMVFMVKGQWGYVLTNNSDKAIPIYQRFYLGGINTLRGLRNVGPTDPSTGEFIGGTTMLCFNTEVVFPLIPNAGIKGVVFFDTGNSWESGYSLSDMRRTAGAGVRWYSPMGPLRLEWGYVLDRKDNESPSRWEFTMGVQF